jgi:hypothetical protein
MGKGKCIKLPMKELLRIKQEQGVSLVCVYDALKFKTRSSKSNLIRAIALQRGGDIVGTEEDFRKTFEQAP